MPKVIAYHGSDHNITKFDHFYKEFSNDEHGPGIYFTNNESIAKGYGRNLYEVEIDLTGFITEKTKRNDARLLKIITENLNEYNLSNYDENPIRAKRLLIEGVMQPRISYIECLMNIWSDVFNLKNPKYIRACVNNNINGIVRKIKPGLTFYIVYNPENIIP